MVWSLQLIGYWLDMIWHKEQPCCVPGGQREVLESLARSQSGAHREVVRAEGAVDGG